MTTSRLLGLLRHLPEERSEIYLHPATTDDFAGHASGYRYAEELAALGRRGIHLELGSVTGLRIDADRVTGVQVGGRVVSVGVVSLSSSRGVSVNWIKVLLLSGDRARRCAVARC